MSWTEAALFGLSPEEQRSEDDAELSGAADDSEQGATVADALAIEAEEEGDHERAADLRASADGQREDAKRYRADVDALYEVG